MSCFTAEDRLFISLNTIVFLFADPTMEMFSYVVCIAPCTLLDEMLLLTVYLANLCCRSSIHCPLGS